MLSGDIPIPHFRRGRMESERKYVQRMTEESEHVLFLTNNQVERHPEVKLKKEEETEEKKSKKKNRLVQHMVIIIIHTKSLTTFLE